MLRTDHALRVTLEYTEHDQSQLNVRIGITHSASAGERDRTILTWKQFI